MISRSYYYAGAQRVATPALDTAGTSVREDGRTVFGLAVWVTKRLFVRIGLNLVRFALGSTSLTLDSSWNKVAEMRYKPCPPMGMLREGESRYTWGSQKTDYSFTGQRSRSGEFGLILFSTRPAESTRFCCVLFIPSVDPTRHVSCYTQATRHF